MGAGGLAYDYVIGEDSYSSTIRPQLKISPLLPQEDNVASKSRFNNQYNPPKRKVPIVETRTPAYFDVDVVPTTTTPYYYPTYYGVEQQQKVPFYPTAIPDRKPIVIRTTTMTTTT